MVRRLATATPCLLKCILSVLIQSVTMGVLVRSECNRTTHEEACLDSSILVRLTYLSNESSSITHSISCNTRKWFHSLDDGPSYRLLNHSSSKYEISDNNLQLRFGSISGSDEGLYGCISSEGNRVNLLCIQVYGRAVFASCPHELTCSESETLTLPASGGNVSFNATVIYTDGGSCGYLQMVSFIELRKTNEIAGTSTILYFCDFEAGPCSLRIGTVIFSRGSSRLEFILTLFNVTTNSIGTYEVIVGTSHPGYSFHEQIRKKFLVDDTNECLGEGICPASSKCANTIGSYICICDAGYFSMSTGSSSDSITCNDINECLEEDICPPSSSCINTNGSYTCVCDRGYYLTATSDGYTCYDVDECSVEGICPAGRSCINTVGSYACTCGSGYSLLIMFDGSQCNDINECLEEGVCPAGSRCINTIGSYTCTMSCDAGYFHTTTINGGDACSDVDECTFGIHSCDDSVRAMCINTDGSYECVCRPGYIGNGESCIPFDDDGCPDICDQHCIQSLPKCACDRGYYLASDNKTCIDIDECRSNDLHTCVNARCDNTNGSFICTCNPGFISDDNYSCIDVNECETGTHSCDENAECANIEGGFSCSCGSSYFGDGFTCLPGMMPIIAKPKLQDKPNHGLQYDIGTDFCIEDPVNTSFHLTINCPLKQELPTPPQFRWSVFFNEIDLISHEERSTLKISTDTETDTLTLSGTISFGFDQTSMVDITCEVSNVFGNDTEKTLISMCEPTQCQDGVTHNCTHECTKDTITGIHRCSCREGFNFSSGTKSVCEDVDECVTGSHNCSSEKWQICNNTEGSFECVCKPGFNFKLVVGNCEDIDECQSASSHDSICPRLSSCVNTNGTYDCICIDGTWMDTSGNCTDVDECKEGNHNCSNFAACINVNQGYDCECHVGFVGDGVTCRVSDAFIIGMSVVGVAIALLCFLSMITVGGIKIKRYCDHHVKFKFRHIMNLSVCSQAGNRQKVTVKGSLRGKFPPSLNVKSADLRVLHPIGQGEFGIVYKGYLAGQYIDEVVAIKTLKGFINDEAVQELLSECVKMKSLNHLHVMTLKGVCLDGGPVPYIVLPYMANGSLLSYLKKERSSLTITVPVSTAENTVIGGEEEKQSDVLMIKKRLLDMCLQVAKGMEYLADEKIVHRDLATRNCMIDMNMIIKVADFGLSVNTGTKEYCRLTGDMGTKLPVMWMAPESLSDYVFSEKSDVWSYGVTCWEIFTGGLVPYVGTKPSSLLTFLQQGKRLDIPNNSACSSEMYSVMTWCWEMEPSERPSFSTLVQALSKSLEKMAGYLPVGVFAGLNEENATYIHVGAIGADTNHKDSLSGQAEHAV